MKKNYKAIIFDADHTLIDYLEDEKAVLRELLPTLGIEPTEEIVCDCDDVSNETWDSAGLNNVNDPYIQEHYHRLYVEHTEDLFRALFLRYPSSADPKEAGLRFMRMMQRPSILCESAEEVLKALKGKYTVCVATNATSALQRARIRPIEQYLDAGYTFPKKLASSSPCPPSF
jgi:FMN phosphatase YigB (HAD superfamily)